MASSSSEWRKKLEDLLGKEKVEDYASSLEGVTSKVTAKVDEWKSSLNSIQNISFDVETLQRSVTKVKVYITDNAVSDIKETFHTFEDLAGIELPPDHKPEAQKLRKTIQTTKADLEQQVASLTAQVEAKKARLEELDSSQESESQQMRKKLTGLPEIRQLSKDLSKEVAQHLGHLAPKEAKENSGFTTNATIARYRNSALTALLVNNLIHAIEMGTPIVRDVKGLMIMNKWGIGNGKPEMQPLVQYPMVHNEILERGHLPGPCRSSLLSSFEDVYAQAKHIYWPPAAISRLGSVPNYLQGLFWNAITAPQVESDHLLAARESLRRGDFFKARARLHQWLGERMDRSYDSRLQAEVKEEIRRFSKQLDYYIRCSELTRYIATKLKAQQAMI